MNKKLTKLLSVFLIAGLIGTGAAVGTVGCAPAEDPGKQEQVVTVTGVTVTAADDVTTVEAGGTLNLTATVAGTNNPAQTVTWSIKSGATATEATISNGVFSAGNVAGSVTVVATSTADTSKSGEITITVTASSQSAGTVTNVLVDADDTIFVGDEIELIAQVVGTVSDKTVTWSIVSGSEFAALNNNLLTATGVGTVVVKATSNADESKSADFTITISEKVKTMYDTLAEKDTNIIKEDFSKMAADSTLEVFTNYGTAGIYVSSNSVAPVKVTTTGTLSMGDAAGGGNVDVIVDYGTGAKQEIEGYFEFTVNSKAGQDDKPTIVFESGKGNEVLAITYSGSTTKNIVYKLNGVATTPAVEIPGAATLQYKVYYKFDIVNGKLALTVNGSEVFADQAITVDGAVGISGVKFSTHNSGKGWGVLDNIAVCATEMSLDNYKITTNNKVAAIETQYGFGGAGYGMAKGSYEAAVSAATTVEAVDTAYTELYTAMLSMLKSQASLYVDGLWTDYTHDAEKVTTLKNAIYDEIEAMTDLADVYAILSNDFADRLEAADIHEDSYYAAVDVTVVIYEKGTTTSVVKAGANLTEKAGQAFTLAELEAAIVVPEGKAIKALYSDAACTTAITESLTLDAAGATEATTMTIYVEFEAVTAVTHTLAITETAALTETTLLNDIFYGTAKLKTENDKNGTGYPIQISLTSGKVAAGAAPANGIKFTVNGPTTVTVVCGQKADKTTKLNVLNDGGSAAAVSNITKNGAAVSAFETLSTTATPDTYTFTLEAGTYHLGGAGGGAYIYALTVVETVAANS